MQESRKEYCIATLLDPRYKSAGFRSKSNAGIAKELLIQEVITDRQSNNPSPQTLNVSDRSIAPETPTADPWDTILVDTEDSEENATEAHHPIYKKASIRILERKADTFKIGSALRLLGNEETSFRHNITSREKVSLCSSGFDICRTTVFSGRKHG